MSLKEAETRICHWPSTYWCGCRARGAARVVGHHGEHAGAIGEHAASATLGQQEGDERAGDGILVFVYDLDDRLARDTLPDVVNGAVAFHDDDTDRPWCILWLPCVCRQDQQCAEQDEKAACIGNLLLLISETLRFDLPLAQISLIIRPRAVESASAWEYNGLRVAFRGRRETEIDEESELSHYHAGACLWGGVHGVVTIAQQIDGT